MNKLFILLGIIGSIIICIFAFIVPSNPFEIIPAMTHISIDKPLWLDIILVGLFIYWYMLIYSYDFIIEKSKKARS